MNFPLLRSALLASVIGLAGVAHAAYMEVVPDMAGNFTITDTTMPGNQADQDYLMNVSPTTNPLPVVFYDTNPGVSQDAESIATLMAAHYGTDANLLELSSTCDSIQGGCSGLTTTSSSFSLSGVAPFDYLAIHLGGGELFFHWSQPITSMTLLALDGAFPGGLSNYRAYLTTPVPGAFLLFLSGMGLLGLRRKLAQPQSEPATPAMA